jgi:hypothetical protein
MSRPATASRGSPPSRSRWAALACSLRRQSGCRQTGGTPRALIALVLAGPAKRLPPQGDRPQTESVAPRIVLPPGKRDPLRTPRPASPAAGGQRPGEPASVKEKGPGDRTRAARGRRRVPKLCLVWAATGPNDMRLVRPPDLNASAPRTPSLSLARRVRVRRRRPRRPAQRGALPGQRVAQDPRRGAARRPEGAAVPACGTPGVGARSSRPWGWALARTRGSNVRRRWPRDHPLMAHHQPPRCPWPVPAPPRTRAACCPRCSGCRTPASTWTTPSARWSTTVGVGGCVICMPPLGARAAPTATCGPRDRRGRPAASPRPSLHVAARPATARPRDRAAPPRPDAHPLQASPIGTPSSRTGRCACASVSRRKAARWESGRAGPMAGQGMGK